MTTRILFNLLLLIIPMITSCQDKPTLEERLYAKYKEEFIIHENSYNFITRMNAFVASPKRLPKIKTYGNYNDSIISDDYPEQLRAYQAEKLAKDIFNNYNLKSFVRCDIFSDVGYFVDNHIAEFKDVLKDSKDSTFIQNVVYLFEDIDNANKDRLLSGVLDMIKYYNTFPGKRIYIKVFFWDKEFIKSKEPDSLNLTVNVEDFRDGKYANDDNIENKKKYIRHVLAFDVKTPAKTQFSTDTLLSIIQPFNIAGNDVTIFK